MQSVFYKTRKIGDYKLANYKEISQNINAD